MVTIRARIALAVVLLAALCATGAPALSQTPKTGGVMNVMQREDLPQGFSIHEAATISSVFPVAPCFSNLVLFDPLKKIESVDTIIPELAEKWSWQDNYRSLVFFLRKDVRWHDGQRFTARDVKYTFDMVREAPDATARLRINPRKDWYANVEALETPDPYTVVFRLKRPQPSLLMLLAAGYAPVYPAHVPVAEFRTRCVGTGPFKLKEWRRGEFIEYVRNGDYFVKGRPYLDGLRYVVIQERGTKFAALQTGRLDAAFPNDETKAIAEQVVRAEPRIVMQVNGTGVNDNLLLNATRPPFNNVKVRQAVSLAIDRRAYVSAVHQGGAVVGASMLPKPFGVWALLEPDLRKLPGQGKAAEDKARARKLLAEAGYGPANPLRFDMTTRAIPHYVDFASFAVSEMKAIGVETTLKQVETAQWHPLATRKEYQAGPNLTGLGVDDPDGVFFENFACASPRNYTGYCNEAVEQLMARQSQELDRKKRLELVWRIQRTLEDEAARPSIAWRNHYYLTWNYVKNLVPHQGIYNWGRMQEVWLDR